MRKFVLAALAASFGVAGPAQAVTIGGFSFDDDAFVDQLTGSSGSYTTTGGSLASVVTDKSAETYAFSFSSDAYLDLAFVDNVAVNGSGNDIVLFEVGTPDTWLVTINGVSGNFTSIATGSTADGFSLNAAALDLTGFGIAAGGIVSSLRVAFVNAGTVPSTALVGALNSAAPVTPSVPEPATWAMMISGFGLAGGAIRRRATRIAFAA